MVGMTNRNQQKQQLVSAGFSLDYVDGWPPKTTLYRHKPSMILKEMFLIK